MRPGEGQPARPSEKKGHDELPISIQSQQQRSFPLIKHDHRILGFRGSRAWYRRNSIHPEMEAVQVQYLHRVLYRRRRMPPPRTARANSMRTVTKDPAMHHRHPSPISAPPSCACVWPAWPRHGSNQRYLSLVDLLRTECLTGAHFGGRPDKFSGRSTCISSTCAYTSICWCLFRSLPGFTYCATSTPYAAMVAARVVGRMVRTDMASLQSESAHA